MERNCPNCGIKIIKRYNIYCSNQCQTDYQYRQYIKDWKLGRQSGLTGISARSISGHIERYLREKHGQSCSLCGWSQVNTVTGRVPLEIDHIDGNWENNTELNLRLICPNCHALTANFAI